MARFVFLFALLISFSCKAQLAGFTLTGNPENPNGAAWTFQQTLGATVYDLKGILYKPLGGGPFPAVIVNHGTGGNANPNGYSDRVCKKMVSWGYVCIATNYTHSGQGAPCGAPGLCDTLNWGASNDNFLRAMKCWDILASLGYADTTCIAAFGHSRGAFLTTGLLGTYPDKFSCAGHTAGGVGHPTDLTFPSTTMVNNISKPYILHHGTMDNIVNIAYDDNIAAIFAANAVTHQYYTYAGYSHSAISQDTLMFSRTKSFFDQHRCLPTTAVAGEPFGDMQVAAYPNPANGHLQVSTAHACTLELFNLQGQLMLTTSLAPHAHLDVSHLPSGSYLCRINMEDASWTHIIMLGK